MGCLSGNNDGMLGPNRAALVTDMHPYRPIHDQHRLFDRVLVEWRSSTGGYGVDEQTHTTSPMLRPRQKPP